MRPYAVLLLLVCLLFPGVVSAQEEYRLQPGDTVQLWIAQDSQLAGDVTVAPDGRISMPLVGSTMAAGMTLGELQTTLADVLQPFFNETVNLNLSLRPDARHDPTIFVAGDVMESGAYPYRQNMTVLHAVAVAGGLYRTALLPADEDRSIELEGLIKAGQTRTMELAIRIARLNAQIAGQTTFAMPDGVNGPEADATYDRELAILGAQTDRMTAQQTSLARLQAISKDTEAAINAQITSVDQRMAIAQERLTTSRQLVERGVLQTSQLREIESDLVAMEGTKSELRSQLAGQQAGILTEEGRVDSLQQDARVELMSQLATAEQERDQVGTALADQQRSLSLYDASQTTVSEVTYQIIRATNGQITTTDAAEETPIVSGDLIRVTRAKPDSPNAPAASAAVATE